MAEFDAISKHLIQTYPEDFAGFTLGREDVEVLEVIDTQQPTVSASHADSLIRVRIDGREALVHNEFQTTDSSEPPMPRRMAGYIGRAVERHGLPICSSVIYLRPDAGRRDPGQYSQLHPGHRVLVQYRVIRLSELDGQRVLDAGHEGLIPFAPLMKPPDRDGFTGVVSSLFAHRSCASDGATDKSGFSRRYVVAERDWYSHRKPYPISFRRRA